MNRLVTHIVLAIMTVVIVVVASIVGTQALIFSRMFGSLPPDLQLQLEAIREQAHQGLPLSPSEKEIFKRFDRVRLVLLRTTLTSLGVAAGLAMFLAWRLSRSIAKPIERVSSAAIDVAKGNFTARAKLTEKQLTAKNEMSELARNFNAMAQSLENYEQERRAMISDIAHELRTPLTALELRVEGMLSDLVPINKEQIEKIKRQIDLLTRLVQDLRTLSLADEGKLSLQKRSTHLATLVKECVSTYELLARAKDIRLEVETKDITANVDPERLTQVLGNLLDNALRVTPESGSIRVSLKEQDHHLELAVEDSGPGIPAADLPHIFDRFAQGKDTKGTSGLGLAIVQTLVSLHGGSVSALNNSSGGAKFIVRLPTQILSSSANF